MRYIKNLICTVITVFLIGPLAGCPTASTAPQQAPTLGAGYVDNYDQQFAQIIAAAETFYRETQDNVTSRKLVPTPTELDALNSFGVAINVAKAAAQQYKASQTSAALTAAQNATGTLKTQQMAVTSQIGGK
jgi:hypothetical protein